MIRALTALVRDLPETNCCRPARVAVGRHADLGGVHQPCGSHVVEVGDHVGQGPQPQPGIDAAAALGQQGADLVDRPGDGGAVYAEPGGEHVLGHAVAQADQGGQQPVNEDQSVPREPAPTARCLVRAFSLACCRSCHPDPTRPPDPRSPRPTSPSPDAATPQWTAPSGDHFIRHP